MDFFTSVSKKEQASQRQKARDLRKTQWWRQKLGLGLCFYCENKFEADEITMDHKIPVSRGGKSTKGNVVASCKECNNKKKNLTPVDQILKELE